MIIAVVTIPLPGPKRDRQAVIDRSVADAPIFQEVPGLRRKYFLNGETGGGGVYEFESRAAAEAWFNADWADWMEGRFGARPSVTIWDNPVVLDNIAGEVRVDGVPTPKPQTDA
ncbi:MAG: YdhR family protein [Rhodobacteraceae bacterium]|nr:YdhR family protein [Paracoccaceae bacterium]